MATEQRFTLDVEQLWVFVKKKKEEEIFCFSFRLSSQNCWSYCWNQELCCQLVSIFARVNRLVMRHGHLLTYKSLLLFRMDGRLQHNLFTSLRFTLAFPKRPKAQRTISHHSWQRRHSVIRFVLSWSLISACQSVCCMKEKDTRHQTWQLGGKQQTVSSVFLDQSQTTELFALLLLLLMWYLMSVCGRKQGKPIFPPITDSLSFNRRELNQS